MTDPTFDHEAQQVLAAAQQLAAGAASGAHILVAILNESSCFAAQILTRNDTSCDSLRLGAEWLIAVLDAVPIQSKDGYGPTGHSVVATALGEARNLGHSEAGTAHLLYALATDRRALLDNMFEAVGLASGHILLALFERQPPALPRGTAAVAKDGCPRSDGAS